METTNLIKSVIQENVVEAKKIASDILLQKLSERLQSKFEEYAPESFLDENNVEEQLELVNEKKKEKDEEEEEEEEKDEEEDEDEDEEEEDEDEDEEEEDEEEEEKMGEDGLVYEDECEDCDGENSADKMNKKAFKKNSLSEQLKGKQHKLDVAEPKGKLTADDFKKLRSMKKISEETEQLDEVSPPGMKKMTHSKKATESFKSKYGKKGKSVQYATAWKKSKKDE